MPFVHVVVLKLKEGTAEDQVAAIISGLHALPAAIPQIQSYRAGVDLGIDPAGCHIGIVGSFASPEDYAVYAKHEAHVGLITSLIKPNLEKRAAVQFAADGAPPGAAALTHAVLLKLKDDATAEQKTAIIEALSTLPAAIPQIRAYRVGPDAGTDPAKFDLAIVGDFEGVEEYQAYAKHEAHVGVITSLIKPNLAERVATQFAGDAPAKRQKPSGAPTHIIRFVDAESGAVCYGEVEDTSGEYTEAAELSGDPLTEVPFERTGRVARVGRLLAPVKTPNILCIGLNYMKHYEEGAKKRGIALPTKPVIFMKTTTALNSHGGEIWRPNMVGEDDALNPSPDDQSLGEQGRVQTLSRWAVSAGCCCVAGNNAGALDFEAELAIIIGKTARLPLPSGLRSPPTIPAAILGCGAPQGSVAATPRRRTRCRTCWATRSPTTSPRGTGSASATSGSRASPSIPSARSDPSSSRRKSSPTRVRTPVPPHPQCPR